MCSRRRARRACVSYSRAKPALPRLGSFSSRSASSSLTAASAAAPRSAARSSSGPHGAATTHSASSCSASVARAAASASRAQRRLRARERAGPLGVAAGQPRAGQRGVRRRHPPPRSASAMRAGGTAPKRTGRQREGIVSSRRPGAELTSTKCAKDAGSSSVFSSEFCDSSFMRSASTITNTRLRDSNGRSAAWRTMLRAHVVDQDVVRAARLDPGEVGMHARQHAPLGVLGIVRAGGDQRRRERARRRALAAARGPVEQVGVRERVLVAQRRLQRDARARLVLERLDHARHLQPREHVRVHLLGRPRSVDPHVAVGVALGQLVVGGGDRALQLLALVLEAIAARRRGRAAAAGSTSSRNVTSGYRSPVSQSVELLDPLDARARARRPGRRRSSRRSGRRSRSCPPSSAGRITRSTSSARAAPNSSVSAIGVSSVSGPSPARGSAPPPACRPARAPAAPRRRAPRRAAAPGSSCRSGRCPRR